MSRYNNILLIKDNEGKRHQKTVRYPIIPRSEDDLYVIVVDEDSLDALAFEYYGDPSLYWILSAANPENIKQGSFYVAPGTQIRIPFNTDTIISNYNRLNP